MKQQEKEKIKKASNEIDAFKKRRKAAAFILLKSIIISGLALLCWTFTMLLVMVMVADPDAGVELFMEVNGMLYQLYSILVGIGIFIFLVDYIFKKKKNSINEIIIEN